MLKSVELLKDFRCLKKDLRIDFFPGINLLVGDQGTGKSTLIDLLSNIGSSLRGEKTAEIIKIDADVETTTYTFNAEKDSPRHLGMSGSKTNSQFAHALAGMYSSHGESLKRVYHS